MTWRRDDHLLLVDDRVVAMLRSDATDHGDRIVAAMNAAGETRGVTDVHNGLTPTARILELEALLEQAKREAEDACQHARVVMGQRDKARLDLEQAQSDTKVAAEFFAREKDRGDAAVRMLESLRDRVREALNGH